MPLSIAAVADHPTYACGADHVGYIHHNVSKFDTLPGVAIKYGVDVGEIKRLNGLVTDRQMFALHSIRIPLPGRHPTAYSMYNAAASTSNLDVVARQQKRSSQQKVSTNMTSLLEFYGLKSPILVKFSGGAEAGGCKARESNEKSRTTENASWMEKVLNYGDLQLMESVTGEIEGSTDRYNHQWLKSAWEFGWKTPEKVLREENEDSRCYSFSSITRDGLALRPRSTSRGGSQASDDSEWSSSSSCYGDSPTADASGKAHKSYSYPNMPDQEENIFSWIWLNTKQRIRFDLRSLSKSTSPLSKPLLEIPPIVPHKFKAALD